MSPHAEFVATFFNEDEESEPRLAYCCMQEPSSASSAFPSSLSLASTSYHSTASVSSMVDQAGSLTGKFDRSESAIGLDSPGPERKERPLLPVWCMRETHTIAPEHGRLDVALRMVHNNTNNVFTTTSNDTSGAERSSLLVPSINTNSLPACNAAMYEYGKCFTNPYFEECNLHPDTSKPETSLNADNNSSSSSTTNEVAEATAPVPSNNPSTNSTTTTATIKTTGTATAATPTTTTTFTYTLVDCAHHSEVVLESWKGLFSNTWEMKCALPDTTLLSRLNSDELSLSAPIVCDADNMATSHNNGVDSGSNSNCNSADTDNSVCDFSLGHTSHETSTDSAQDCDICCHDSNAADHLDHVARQVCNLCVLHSLPHRFMFFLSKSIAFISLLL